MSSKILVSGDVRGELTQLFARVGALHASKGPFDCLLCVGDFFGDSKPEEVLKPFRNGEQTPPLRTYFLGPAPPDAPDADSDGNVELCTDLICLTGASIVTLHSLRIAFASGRGASSLTDAVAELRARAAEPGFGCDVLLTHEWPRGCFRQLPTDGGVPADLLPDRDLATVGEELVAELAASLRPRYHFCGGEDAFFARAPYRATSHASAPNRPPPSTIVARLIALASVNPDKKKKWLHALSLVPCSSMHPEQLAAAPDNTTESPYPYLPPPPPAPPASAAVARGPAGGDVPRYHREDEGGAPCDEAAIQALVDQRQQCKLRKQFSTADGLREELTATHGVEVDDKARVWRLIAAGPGGQKRKRPEYASDARAWVHDSCWFCMASPQFGARPCTHARARHAIHARHPPPPLPTRALTTLPPPIFACRVALCMLGG